MKNLSQTILEFVIVFAVLFVVDIVMFFTNLNFYIRHLIGISLGVIIFFFLDKYFEEKRKKKDENL